MRKGQACLAATGITAFTMEAFGITAIVLISVVASCIQRVTGFGFGIVAMTVLPYLLPSYPEATALSGMLGALTSFIPAIRMRRDVEWRKLLPILVTFALLSFVAVHLVVTFDGLSLKHWLGGVLIAVSLYFFLLSERIRLRPTVPLQLGMGTLSGLMGGMFAMQGPPAVIYFMASASSKESYLAMTQWYFFAGNLVMTLFRAREGIVTTEVAAAFLWCIPAVALGTFIGSRVYDKIRIELLRKIVYAFIGVAGLVALISSH